MLSNQRKNKIAGNSSYIGHESIDKQLEQEIVKGQITLLSLKQEFDKNRQFPAMGNSISQIMSVTNENGGIRKLADIILRDQSLTGKILSIVNSSSYNQFGGEINTISRAVVILGLDQIQSLSLSIIVFEKLNQGPMAETLKSYACQSFLSAFFAKKLVEQVDAINSEEAFLASMFHNLGQQVILYFFPEQYVEISRLKIDSKFDEEAACMETLGLNFTDVGQYIALQLKLPKNIIFGIQTKPKFIKERPSDAKEYLGQLSSLTNEIIETAACGDNDFAVEKLNQIIERYHASFVLDYEKILNMLEVLSQTLMSYCSVLGINPNENTFCKNFSDFVNFQQEMQPEKESE